MDQDKDEDKQRAGQIGGARRAEVLPPIRRAEIARKAAEARWQKHVPRATHWGTVSISDMQLPCFVLDDGRRVISGRGMTRAIGMKGRGQGAQRIGEHRAIKPFMSDGLASALENPIMFLGLSPRGSAPSSGFEAIVLQEICEALLKARDAGALQTEQEKRYAHFADMLIRAFARIGIVALVDEATGYQEVRDKLALQALLDRFLRKELAAWAKRFPDEFYKEMFRLRGWQWLSLKGQRPGIVGSYTNDLIYERLAPGILEELQARNPKDERGHRRGKHHQLLTEDVGHPALAQHLHAVIGLMRASSSWDQFYLLLNRAFPKKGQTLELALGD
ncbi:P63C domain-containing protein [Bradyrhizobium oligotrophicum]|uniref:P63C domain-containing protein n=1 Tax=Bradyrhizobium oligotrophicum TaxID=44255 RepID=UPI003EBB7409